MQLPRRPLIRCTMFGGPVAARETVQEVPVTSLRALAGLLVYGHLTDHEFRVLAGRILSRSERPWRPSSS